MEETYCNPNRTQLGAIGNPYGPNELLWLICGEFSYEIERNRRLILGLNHVVLDSNPGLASSIF